MTDTCAFCGADNPTKVVIMEPICQMDRGTAEIQSCVREFACDECADKNFIDLLRMRAGL